MVFLTGGSKSCRDVMERGVLEGPEAALNGLSMSYLAGVIENYKGPQIHSKSLET